MALFVYNVYARWENLSDAKMLKKHINALDTPVFSSNNNAMKNRENRITINKVSFNPLLIFLNIIKFLPVVNFVLAEMIRC